MSSSPKPPLSIPTFCLAPILVVAFVAAIRPNVLVRAAVLLGYVAVALGACSYTLGTDAIADYSIGSWFGTNCFIVWWLLIYLNPVEDARYRTDTVPMSAMPLWKRMCWIVTLWFNARVIGWNVQEIDKLPPQPPSSRIAFCIRSFRQIVYHILLVDVAQTYKRLNPLFQLTGDSTVSLGAQGYFLRCLNVLAYMAISYGVLNIQYYAMAILAVMSGLWEPAQWPDAFGKWSDSCTVRRFWGRTWHQMMRRVASSTGKYAAHGLGCIPHSWLSARVQLLVGFSASGLAHVVGDAMVDRRFMGCSFLFFFLQPFAITVEDAVAAVAKEAGVKESWWTYVIGYAWTFTWFSWTTPWFVDWSLRAGTGTTEVIPFTLLGRVINHIPIIPSSWLLA